MNVWTRTAAKFAALLSLAFAPAVMLAQINSGSMAGSVTDPSGGAVPNAQVVATETQSGSVYTTTTTSAGDYVFTSLRPGSYNLTVTAPTFKKATAAGIPVYVTTRAAHNFVLAVGAATDTVTVEANAPSLETDSSDVGTVLTSEQVEDLPSAAGGAMRSLAALTLLTPGAVGTGTNGGTAYVKIGGGQTFGSDNLLDGLSTQRSENGTELFDQMTPSLDAIEEFRVETLAPPAYLGRTTGGIANFKTRSGTNTYHGTVYDFYRNTVFDANYYFNKGNAGLVGKTQDNDPNFARPTDMHQDYGVTLGGPVHVPHFYNGQDKSFFFFSYEQVPTHSGYTSYATVPTVAQRNGDFSATLGAPIPGASGSGTIVNPCTGDNILFGQLFDPLTTKTVGGVECRTPFANNQIPVNRSTVAQAVLALIPQPNFTGAGTTNYIYHGTQKVNQFDVSLRADENLSPRNHIFAFGNMRENLSTGQVVLPGPVNPGSNLQDFYAKLLRFGYDFTITPTLINQVTVGGNRINSFNSAPESLLGVNYDRKLGIPNTPAAGTTFPVFNIANMNSLGSPNYDDNVDNALLADDNLSWQKGAHSVRVGGTYRWTQFSYENNGPAAGYFNFSTTQTAGTNNATVESGSGNGIASFLLGVPAGTGRSLQVHFPRWIQNYYAAYVQDDWKVGNHLTLNLGFRYSVDTPRHEAEGDISAFDPTLPNPLANGIPGALRYGGTGTGRDGNKGEQFAQTYFKNFEPRIGFAWSLKDDIVLRGAYTIMSGPLIYADYGQGLSAGFTTSTPAQTNDPFTYSGLLDNGPPSLSLSPIINPSYNIGGGVDYVAKTDGRPSQVQNWTLETETQIAPDLILTVGYLGERGTRLRSLVYWENSLNPAYFGLGDTLYQPVQSAAGQAAGVSAPFANFFNVTNGQVGQALEPFPQYGYINNDSYLQNRGQSTYNALTFKLDRKFRNGLNLLAGYTFSKTFTDADSIQPFFATVLSQGGTQNPYDLKAERSISEQDVPNNLVVSYLYELPVGKGKHFAGGVDRAVDTVIGGWRVGGVVRYVSGQPVAFWGAQGVPYFDGGIRFSRNTEESLLTPAAAGGKYSKYNVFGFCPTNNTNPKCSPLNADVENPTAFYNRLAFIDVNDATHRGSGPYRFGDMPRNDAEFRTAFFSNEDMNLNKNFPIHEQIAADLRWEVFNVFNRHVFNKPDTGVYDANFGQISSTIDGPRSMQVVLKIRY